MEFERKHYIYIILAILLSLIAIDGTGTIINYNNYTNGSSNGSFYTDVNMNENNITEVTELRNNGTLYTPYINLGSSKIELGTKFLGSPLRMWDLQITGMNSYYNLNMNNKSLLNCLNCANKTELNEKINKSGDNITGHIYMNHSEIRNISGFIVSEYQDYSKNIKNAILGNFASTEVGTTTYFFMFLNRYWDNYATPPNLKNGTYPERYGVALIQSGSSTSATLDYKITPPNSTTQITKWSVNQDGNISQKGKIQSDFYKSSGAGYEYICVEKSTGNFINSSVACDLI